MFLAVKTEVAGEGALKHGGAVGTGTGLVDGVRSSPLCRKPRGKQEPGWRAQGWGLAAVCLGSLAPAQGSAGRSSSQRCGPVCVRVEFMCPLGWATGAPNIGSDMSVCLGERFWTLNCISFIYTRRSGFILNALPSAGFIYKSILLLKMYCCIS